MPDVTQEQLFKLALEIKGQEEMKRLADETGKAGQAVGEYIAKIKDLSAEQMAADPKLRELMQRFQDLGEESTRLKDKIDKLTDDPDKKAEAFFESLGGSVGKLVGSGSLAEAGNQIGGLWSVIKGADWSILSKAMMGPAGWVAAGYAVVEVVPKVVEAFGRLKASYTDQPLEQFTAKLNAAKAAMDAAALGHRADGLSVVGAAGMGDTDKEARELRDRTLQGLDAGQLGQFNARMMDDTLSGMLAKDPMGSVELSTLATTRVQMRQMEADAQAAGGMSLAQSWKYEGLKKAEKEAADKLAARRDALTPQAQAAAREAVLSGAPQAQRILGQVAPGAVGAFAGARDTVLQRRIDQGVIDQQVAAAEAQAQIDATRQADEAAAGKERREGIMGDFEAGQRWDAFLDNRQKRQQAEADRAKAEQQRKAEQARRLADQETSRQAQLAAQAFGQNQAAQLQLQQGILAGNDTSAIAADLAKQLVSPVTGMVAAKRAADQIVMQAQAQAHAQMMSLMQVYNDDRIAQAMMWRQWQEQMMQFQAGMQLRGRW